MSVSKDKIKVKVNSPKVKKQFLGTIHIGADHAGYYLKEALVTYLQKLNYEVIDHGADRFEEFDDYPDFVIPVAHAVSLRPNNIKGIIIGGSGQGEAMAANQFPDVRAAVFYGNKMFQGTDILKLTRQHNDSNILSIGARFVTTGEAKESVRVWLNTPFLGDYKYIRRIKKIAKILREIRLKDHF